MCCGTTKSICSKIRLPFSSTTSFGHLSKFCKKTSMKSKLNVSRESILTYCTKTIVEYKWSDFNADHRYLSGQILNAVNIITTKIGLLLRIIRKIFIRKKK